MRDICTIRVAASRACRSLRVLSCQVIVDSPGNIECGCHWRRQHHFKKSLALVAGVFITALPASVSMAGHFSIHFLACYSAPINYFCNLNSCFNPSHPFKVEKPNKSLSMTCPIFVSRREYLIGLDILVTQYFAPGKLMIQDILINKHGGNGEA